MYARLTTFEGADPSTKDEALERIREEVLPALQALDGFSGYVMLTDDENRKAHATTFWESRETAEAAEQQMAQRREAMAERFGLTIKSVRLLEAPIVDVRSATKV